MIARANITFDERYHRGFYSDWLRHRSKRRKFAPLFATTLLLAGILALCLAKHSRGLGFALVAIGVGYLIDVLSYRRRWIRQRMNAGGSSFAQIDFYEDRILMKTERSQGCHRLPGFVDVTATDRGVFLYPQTDISFYIPWDSIEPFDAVPKVRELLCAKGKLPP
jgi:hypothetical protein